MERQMSFSDVEYASHRVTTKKEEFLRQMDSLVPWDAWCALIAPFWHPGHPGKRGRRPVPVETMPRLYLLQCWYNLSDVATEEAVYDSRATRRPTRPRRATTGTTASRPTPASTRGAASCTRWW